MAQTEKCTKLCSLDGSSTRSIFFRRFPYTVLNVKCSLIISYIYKIYILYMHAPCKHDLHEEYKKEISNKTRGRKTCYCFNRLRFGLSLAIDFV